MAVSMTLLWCLLMPFHKEILCHLYVVDHLRAQRRQKCYQRSEFWGHHDPLYGWSCSGFAGCLGLKPTPSRLDRLVPKCGPHRECGQNCLCRQENIPVPDQLIPYVTEPVRVLGAFTCVKPRRLCPDELERVNKAKKTIGLLASIKLPFNLFHQHVAMFAMPQAAYGWFGRLPTQAVCAELWAALCRGDNRCKAANRHVRALFLGGNSHLDLLSIKRLMGAVIASPNRTIARWNGPNKKALCSSCAKRLKNLTTSSALLESSKAIMIALGLIAPEPPWTNLIAISSSTTCATAGGPANFKSFSTLGGTKLLIVWPKHLASGDTRDWILSNPQARTLGLGAFISSSWLRTSSGVNEPCVWGCGLLNPHFHHMAWECPSRNTNLAPPSCPFLARFGWSSSNLFNREVSEVRSHLENLVSVLWSLRHPASSQGPKGEGGGGAFDWSGLKLAWRLRGRWRSLQLQSSNVCPCRLLQYKEISLQTWIICIYIYIYI